MVEVKIKDKVIEVSSDQEALVLAIQELTNQIRRLVNG